MNESRMEMRKSNASLALIAEVRGGEIKYLAQWNDHWQKFSFVGGHIEGDETPRECIRREVGEELVLVEGVDYELAIEEAIRLEYVEWSESAQEDTLYTMYLYRVNLRNQESRAKVDANSDNRWLTATEIRAERTSDDKPVSQTMGLLLDKLNLAPSSDANLPPQLKRQTGSPAVDTGRPPADGNRRGRKTTANINLKAKMQQQTKNMNPFPELVVAVTVIARQQTNQILAVWNPRWGVFTLPMTKQRTWHDPNVPAGERTEHLDRTAARAAAEALGRTLDPGDLRRLLPEERKYGQSDSDGAWKMYRLNLYGLTVDEGASTAPGVAFEWLPAAAFASREPVSKTARFVLDELALVGLLPPWTGPAAQAP